MKTNFSYFAKVIFVLCASCMSSLVTARSEDYVKEAGRILDATNIKGGLIVHIGCGDGRLTAAFEKNGDYLVQGLDSDAGNPAPGAVQENIQKARRYIQSLGMYGKVSVEQFDGRRLPYIENLVNLVVVSENPGKITTEEIMRVLCPGGVACIKDNGKWVSKTKPRPDQLDEWTHYLHDASNNAVSHDSIIGPPRRMQWIGSPRWARHHDRMSSVSAVVSTAGRVFYIFDEGPRESILLEPRWSLIARDAFNGTILWKRQMGKWFTHLWPLKSGPAQLPRHLVAEGNRVYVTLGIDAPLTALDAATGKTIRTYENTRAVEEIICSDGVLFLLVNKHAEEPEFANPAKLKNAYGGKFWDEKPREIMAVKADDGEILWSKKSIVLPVTLAADKRHVYFHDGRSIVCLDRVTGKNQWRSDPIARSKIIESFYAPTLVVYQDVVLFSGGETAGLQTGSWYESGKDTMTALSAGTGKILWTAYHPPSGYRSPEDLLVANGLVWTGETTSGRAVGVFTGRDPLTGEVIKEFKPDVNIYWFHHRCYRGKATDKYLLMSRAGTEFVDIRNEQWIPNHWTRGACLYGIMPANGMVYNPPHPCACYLESKLYGFNALAPASKGPRIPERAASRPRLEKGPAYDEEIAEVTTKDDWPTYRHDAARSGRATTIVPAELKIKWEKSIEGKPASPVIAGAKVFIASAETHSIHALDAGSGNNLWSYTAGGRVDSAPTVYQGRILFGSADGYVYCLRASDGTLVWRFRAAPIDEQLMSFEQIESVWPVHGSVLIQDGVLYCVAGRSMFLDGGMHFWRLDPKTGRALSHSVLDEKDESGRNLQDYVSWLNMPVAMPDVLSSDGRLVYMRSQPFNLDGTRLPLEAMPSARDADRGAPPPTQRPDHAHLFSPTGFLDDSWWHRTYWMYGSTFVSGWCGYYLSGTVAPAGRILVFDDSKVYGFGRKPQYFRWTTPIEHHLFATSKVSGGSGNAMAARRGRSLIHIEKSKSLNPAGKPITVEAWVKAEKNNGVILAHGGSSHGYVLYLQGGRPRFAVRINGEQTSVEAKTKVVGRWVHIAGVLTTEKKLQIFVDGKLVASNRVPGLIAQDPQEAMEIGEDNSSNVGEYSGTFAFNGLIDEVRLYHRALSEKAIAKCASAAGRNDIDKTDLVLRLSFDAGDAIDLSGKSNKCEVEGAVAADGKFGRAMKFTGSGGAVPGFKVEYDWTADLPIFARAMVLAEKTLFLAGPADLINEPQVFRQIGNPQIMPKLAEQTASLEGKKGAMLLAFSADKGKEIARIDLDSPPVFDGMSAADSRIYISTIDGKVVCLAGE
jgi:outer membrane protein assembly factor BamB